MSFFPLKISIIAGLVILAFFSFFSFLIVPTDSVLTGLVTSMIIGLIAGSLSVSFFAVGDGFNGISSIFVTKNSIVLGLITFLGGSGFVIFFGSVLLDWLNVIQGMFLALTLFAIAGILALFYFTSYIFKEKNQNSHKEKSTYQYTNKNYSQPVSQTENKTTIDYEGVASSKYHNKQENSQKADNKRYCENCGSTILDSSDYCNNCGSNLE